MNLEKPFCESANELKEPDQSTRIADLESTLVTLAKELTSAYIQAMPNADLEKVFRKTFRELKRLGLRA